MNARKSWMSPSRLMPKKRIVWSYHCICLKSSIAATRCVVGVSLVWWFKPTPNVRCQYWFGSRHSRKSRAISFLCV
ncbi:Uncharacterised protein [Vibrio cholerae]|nr:Uncharacterised protein [Vibrio cholerae]CSI33073.1 Uncharacterised protein [Vibrio cholerae]CSI49873.1 Uncharacterised protein [Vibrio cholerae]